MNTRTRVGVAEAIAAIKKQRKEERQLLAVRQVQTDMSKRPPTKKDAKPIKMSQGTINSYGANVFKVAPGATRDETKTGAFRSFLKMIEAEGTGTRLATKAELRRLSNSARNANTTYGNYVNVFQH